MVRSDVAIIGAGPIGIELAVAFKRHGIDYVHLDAGQVGQTMFCWPPQTRWFSSNDRIAIAGVPLQTVDQSKCTREEYLRYLRTVVQQYDLKINTFEPVAAIRRVGNGFEIATRPAGGERLFAVNKVVLATGGTSHPRRLGIPGEELPHVSHYMADPHLYFRRRVLIVGGRNSAVEAALRIHNVGAEVVLSHRRGELDGKEIKYWLYPEIMSLMKTGAIEAHLNTVLTRIEPAKAVLSRCDAKTLAAVDGKGEIEVAADFVLLLVGYVADMSLAKMAGVELIGESRTPEFDPRTMETNVAGVFVAGTMTGGTQEKFRVFLENCHVHVDRIVAALTGARPPEPAAAEEVAIPES